MSRRCGRRWVVLAIAGTVVLASVGLIARSALRPQPATTVEDHQAEWAIGENEYVTRFVVPVDGYRYVNDDGGSYENVAATLDVVESESGSDAFGAISLHAVVADDPSQNTAQSWNEDWEVGYLNLIQLNEAIPFGIDEEWSEFAIRLSIGDRPYEAVDQLGVSGTTVLVFENAEMPHSRFHYVWLDQGVGGIIDGADRAPLERWLEAYLAVPKLAEGETTELAERLVTVPGFRYSNVDLDSVDESERPVSLDVPHSLHFLTNSNGSIGMLALAPVAHIADVRDWVESIADYRVTRSIEVRGHPVDVLEGRFGDRLVQAYAWDDGDYAGVLTTNSDLDEQVLTFLEAFLES